MEYWTRYFNFWANVLFIIGTVSGESCDSSKCTSCSGNTCLSCPDGYYPHERGCTTCKYPGCRTCLNNLSCSSCNTGLWGTQCNQLCNNGCEESTCNFSDGNCISCRVGYFKSGTTCLPCSFPGCFSCFDGNRCDSCKDGKWGDYCDNDCGADCFGNTCNKQDGSCQCMSGFNETTYCTACQTGFYGPQCDKLCTSCNSMGCHRNGTCYNCANTYVYGLNCNIQCSSLCQYGTCDRWSGECPLNCSSRCELCDSSTGNCTKCRQNNNYGNACQYYCNTGCFDQNCNHTTEECLLCIVGHWGPFCNYSCSSGCSSRGCHQESGKCIECKSLTLYGDLCEKSCNNNCKDLQCNRNGNCTSGCVTNQYGSNCQLKCSETCKATTIGSWCDDLGRCLEGCVQGYTGENCKTVKTIKDTSTVPSTDATPLYGDADQQNGVEKPVLPVAAIGGGIGGLVLLIVVIVLIVVLLQRRRRKSQKEAASPMKDLNNEYHTIDIVSEANKRLSTRSNGVQETPAVATSEYELEDVVAPPVPGNEEEEADKFLEIDDDEAQRKEKRRVAPPLEENVYYISLQEIQKRKVRVSDLPAFVADKTMAYYEEEFDKFPEGITRTVNAAKSPGNVGKNRYKGLYAYDDSRVKVSGFDTDYINANYIDGYKKRNAYIASLGPMKKQMGNYGVFWAMVWQQKVEKIVMVTKLKEEGRDKCEQYWPSPGQSHVYGGVKVTCQRELVFAEFTRRQLILSMGSKSRKVHHLHFTAWPDKGIPDDVTTLVEFRQRVLNASSTLDGPTLVHCSAGIGRTGTYIALDSLTKEGEAEAAVEIPGCIINMRQNRTNMVQTAEQYEFLHHALVHTLTLSCAQITADNFPQYMATTSAAQFAQQFKRLTETDHIVSDEEISAIERNKSEKNKNRKGADIPGDAHRPHLFLGISQQQSGYINAVYINGFLCRRRFLLAQTPLPGTVVDFLTLVFQENCVAIVSFQEDSDRKDVGTYYPADNQVLHKGKFTVHSSKVNGSNQYTIQRELTIEFSGICTGDKTRKIQHYVFTDWDAKSNVPGSPERFVAFIEKMETLSGGPILLHCRDGGGRSGLFCAVASLLEKVKIEREVSVVNAIRRIKARRPNAIHCQAQFDFCHQCVLCHINSNNDYVNIQNETN